MKNADFERLFGRIPPLAGRAPDDFTITPLAGYTNRNFRLHNEKEDWVLRVPRVRTNRFIDRDAEVANQSIACDLGIAPRVAWHDDSGLSLTPTLSGRCLTEKDLDDDGILHSLAATLGKLHRSGQRFDNRIRLGDLLQQYYSMLPLTLREKYRPRLDAAMQLLPSIEARDHDYVPSHNDPVLENLLLARDRLWLIDWEYSAMAPPCWDLAIVCNAASLDERQSGKFLRAYCGSELSMEESLLCDYRNLLQLLSDCWLAALTD